MQNVNDILYSPVSRPQLPPTWALLLRIYTRRVVWFERGLRLAHYDDSLTTVIYNSDLPERMTHDNCQDYRYINGKLVYSPFVPKGVL